MHIGTLNRGAGQWLPAARADYRFLMGRVWHNATEPLRTEVHGFAARQAYLVPIPQDAQAGRQRHTVTSHRLACMGSCQQNPSLLAAEIIVAGQPGRRRLGLRASRSFRPNGRLFHELGRVNSYAAVLVARQAASGCLQQTRCPMGSPPRLPEPYMRHLKNLARMPDPNHAS